MAPCRLQAACRCALPLYPLLAILPLSGHTRVDDLTRGTLLESSGVEPVAALRACDSSTRTSILQVSDGLALSKLHARPDLAATGWRRCGDYVGGTQGHSGCLYNTVMDYDGKPVNTAVNGPITVLLINGGPKSPESYCDWPGFTANWGWDHR